MTSMYASSVVTTSAASISSPDLPVASRTHSDMQSLTAIAGDPILRVELVTGDKGNEYFRGTKADTGENDVYLRGVHGVLRKSVYPGWTLKKALAIRGTGGLTGGLGPDRAKVVGIRCDNQLTWATDRIVRDGLSIAQVLEQTRENRIVSGHARNVLKFFHAEGMTPIATQVGVGSVSMHVGTMVDVVCRKENSLIIVEVKTNWSPKYLRLPCNKMAKRYSPVNTPNTPLEQYKAQAAFTAMLFRATYPGWEASGVVLRTVVVVSDPDGVTAHDVGEWGSGPMQRKLVSAAHASMYKRGR